MTHPMAKSAIFLVCLTLQLVNKFLNIMYCSVLKFLLMLFLQFTKDLFAENLYNFV
jgi:hypothetical protein